MRHSIHIPFVRLAVGALLAAIGTVPTIAAAPSIGVSDQSVTGGAVSIGTVEMPEAGFVTIHAATAEDKPVVPASIGHAAGDAGTSRDVRVNLTAPVKVGDRLFAMLHTDTGRKGVYEFGPGSVDVDKPMIAGGKPVVRPFALTSAAAFQAPAMPDAQPVSGRDRVYTADQSSNTVTVIDPAAGKVLGTIALGTPRIEKSLAPVNRHQENVQGSASPATAAP